MSRTRTVSAPHLHGCARCRNAHYCPCDQTGRVVCLSCRQGVEPPLWQVNRRPKDCCRVNARPATAEERKKYALSASDNWWICRDCKRVQSFNPSRST